MPNAPVPGSYPPLPRSSAQSWSLRGTTFGPVPSRRLGCSLGINNIPAKACTYSCAYCQVGPIVQMLSEPQSWYSAAVVARAVRERLDQVKRTDGRVDHLTFVPDGEPTIDKSLGAVIHLLRPLGVPTAVITNGSLLFMRSVRAALHEAEYVCLKVDTVGEETWRKLDRPHRRLKLEEVLGGMRTFASEFAGRLTTETMLVAGVNDSEEELRATADFISELGPEVAYLATPTRPPAEDWAVAPDEKGLKRAGDIFRRRLQRVLVLTDLEQEALEHTGDPVAEILEIAEVHPIREATAKQLLETRGTPWSVLSKLVQAGRLLEVPYGPDRYFARPARRRPAPAGEPPS